MVMVLYIFTDIIIESKRKVGFKLFAIFPRFPKIDGWGSKEVGLRDRLVCRGMMRWSGRETATSVLWCAWWWRNLAKRADETDFRIRLSSP